MACVVGGFVGARDVELLARAMLRFASGKAAKTSGEAAGEWRGEGETASPLVPSSRLAACRLRIQHRARQQKTDRQDAGY